MSNLNLSDLRAEVNKNYGPWSITFGTADTPRVVEYNHPLLSTPAARKEMDSLILSVARFVSGNVTEVDLKDFENSKANGDPYKYFTNRIEKAFSQLAVQKDEHRALVKELNGEFVMWEKILGEFFAHYGDTPGESEPSQNS